jgi:hypothetical protein
MTILPASIWDVADLAAMLREGLPAAAGGMLDQARTFLAACRFLWREEADWEKRIRKRP